MVAQSLCKIFFTFSLLFSFQWKVRFCTIYKNKWPTMLIFNLSFPVALPPQPSISISCISFIKLRYVYLQGINDGKRILEHKRLVVYRNEAQEPSQSQQRS